MTFFKHTPIFYESANFLFSNYTTILSASLSCLLMLVVVQAPFLRLPGNCNSIGAMNLFRAPIYIVASERSPIVSILDKALVHGIGKCMTADLRS